MHTSTAACSWTCTRDGTTYGRGASNCVFSASLTYPVPCISSPSFSPSPTSRERCPATRTTCTPTCPPPPALVFPTAGSVTHHTHAQPHLQARSASCVHTTLPHGRGSPP